jgi:hypothetical protein
MDITIYRNKPEYFNRICTANIVWNALIPLNYYEPVLSIKDVEEQEDYKNNYDESISVLDILSKMLQITTGDIVEITNSNSCDGVYYYRSYCWYELKRDEFDINSKKLVCDIVQCLRITEGWR